MIESGIDFLLVFARGGTPLAELVSPNGYNYIFIHLSKIINVLCLN